jgi:superoxide dismutase, Fe-Mn family
MTKFIKPDLLYDYNALEPIIDEKTMRLHHQNHHQAYVNGLDDLSASTPSNVQLHSLLAGLESNGGVSDQDKTILKKFGGGHYNHSLFWQYMSPNSSVASISIFLGERIEKDFGSLENFKSQFSQAALKIFGSGWCWWVFDKSRNLSYITTTQDQINPIMDNENLICLLGLDVWEHAYYLKYVNERAKYINNWWSVVNWGIVSRIHDNLIIEQKPFELTNHGYIQFDD